jgi:aminoglycoside phosphotransferase (APT) family kinase protein
LGERGLRRGENQLTGGGERRRHVYLAVIAVDGASAFGRSFLPRLAAVVRLRLTATWPTSLPGPARSDQDNSKKRIAETPSAPVVPNRTGTVKVQRQSPASSATVARVTHAKFEITAEVVRDLLRDQHPDLADRPVTLGARGWVNQLWRLGDDLAVRLPWATQSADALLLREHEWLPALAPRLPLAVPVPQRLGAPSERFPRPWIVTTWVRGEPADRAPVTRAEAAADALAGFLSALHQPAPAGAPVSLDGRGGPLADSRKGFANFLAEAVELGLIPDPDAVRAVWEDAVAAPAWDGPAIWLHGDLHPANVLTADGTYCGVIDFGALCVGDPAWDLAAGWILLPTGAVDRFYRAYRPAANGAHGATGADSSHGADAATQRRARGLAVIKALVCILIGDAGDHGRPGGKPTWGPPGHAALQRLTATAPR